MRSSGIGRYGLAVLALTALLALLNGRREFDLQLDLESSASGGNVVVRYDDESVAQPLLRGLHRYAFRIPAARVSRLRIDLSPQEATMRIGAVVATQRGKVLRSWGEADLEPGNGIAEWHPEARGGARFALHAAARQPYLALAGSGFAVPPFDLGDLAAMALVAACIVAAVAFVRSLGPPLPAPGKGIVPAALGIAIGLVLALALLTTTARSVSPDETSHLAAAGYYAGHWLPPAVGDPASLPSYSEYGASYLNELDVAYPLAARFAAALSFTGLDNVLRLRLFNVALLLLCAACAWRSRLAAFAMLPLLCSAQAWYVFGYFNADAIGLTAAFLLATALATWLEREGAAAAPPARIQWRWAITLGVLIALCLLSKRTLYPFLPFIVGYGLWRSGFRAASAYPLAALGLALLGAWYYAGPPFPGVRALIPLAGPRIVIALVALFFVGWAAWLVVRNRPADVPPPRTLLTAIAIGAAIFAVRLALETGINGLPAQKALALRDLAERIAAPIFRPSVAGTPASYLGMALAAKGIGLGDLVFGAFRWPSFVASSFFGLYGYLNIWAPAWMYRAQYFAGAVLLAAVAFPLARRASSRMVLAIGAMAAFLTIELALLNSWVFDFQPQGRYVFGILPILGVLLLQRSLDGNVDRVDRWADLAARISVGALWILALLSFALVALPGLLRL